MLPLGGFSDFHCQQEEMKLCAGDAVLLMRDGLPERSNDADEMLDCPGVKKLLEEVAWESPQPIIDALVAIWRQMRPWPTPGR